MKRSVLDKDLLKRVKLAFVPQPGGAPMDPAAMGGAPMDPAMAGGMPPPGMDPAMAGMVGGAPMPPPPMDSAAMAGSSANGSSMITMTTDEFMKFIKQLVALIKGMDSDKCQASQASNTVPASSTADLTEVSAKLDALLNSLN
jgi:hypothetical protein